MEEILKVLIADPDRTNALAAVANAVLAAAALLIATVSIFVSWRSLATQRTHNKLSVRPIPYIMLGDYLDKISIGIKNNGSGPLIIKYLSVTDGKNTTKDIISWMPHAPPAVPFQHFTSLVEERSVIAGGELILLQLEGDPEREIFVDFRNECRLALANLKIQLSYADIYGDEFPQMERAMDWFARPYRRNDTTKQVKS